MKKVSDRLAGLAATLLLQAIFIALFLQTSHLGAPPKELARELTFILPRLQPVLPPRTAPRLVRPPIIAAPQAPPIITTPPIAAPPIANVPSPDIQSLGQSLFGCAPENLINLSPEKRARCRTGYTPPDNTVAIVPPSHVKDPIRRAAEMAARNTPARVPCTKMQNLVGGATAVIADPVCMLKGILDGFHNGLPP